MRVLRRLAFMALASALAIAAASSAQDILPKFSLSITAPNPAVKPGENVPIDVTYRNISDAPLPTGRTSPADQAYDIEIAGPDGSVPPETPYGRKIHFKDDKHSPSGSVYLLSLNPGEAMQQTVYVNRVYDMSRPGVYTISISRTVYASNDDWKAHKGVVVKSNAVQVTVTN